MNVRIAALKAKRLAARPTLDVAEWADADNPEGRFYVGKISTRTALEVLRIQRRLCPALPENASREEAEAAFAAALQKSGEDLLEFYLLVVSKSLQDEAGELLFDTFDGRRFLEGEDPNVLARVASEVQSKNGLDPAEDPAKNSRATPADSSCSS